VTCSHGKHTYFCRISISMQKTDSGFLGCLACSTTQHKACKRGGQ
jgi:hypothetical protein